MSSSGEGDDFSWRRWDDISWRAWQTWRREWWQSATSLLTRGDERKGLPRAAVARTGSLNTGDDRRMWSPASIAQLLYELGGIASAAELRAHGLSAQDLRLAHDYGSLRRVRRGWYAHPQLAAPVIQAWAWGGVLSCHSAIEFGEDIYRADSSLARPLHVCVPVNSPIPSRPLSARSTVPVVLHWETVPEHGNRPRRGHPRQVVASTHTAARHASRCDRTHEPNYRLTRSRVRRTASPGWLD